MQRPTAVISPYGSVSDTIDMKPIRTPTTRQGKGWLLKRGFEDTSAYITPELIVDREGPFLLHRPSGGYNLVTTDKGTAFEVAGPTKNYVKNPRMRGIEPINYAWDEVLNGPGRTVPNWTDYNSGVPEPDKGYHAHVVEGGGPEGVNCYRFINKYSNLGLAPYIFLATSTVLDSSFGNEVSEGDIVTLSFDMKVSHLDKFIRTGIYHYYFSTGSRGFGGTTSYLRCHKINTWERKTVSFVIDSDWDLSKVSSIYLYGQQAGVEETAWVANVQLEKSSVMTPLTEGDLGEVDNWEGEPLDSASYRGNPNTYWATSGRLSPVSGTIITKFKPRLSEGTRYIFLRSGGTPSTSFASMLGGDQYLRVTTGATTHRLTSSKLADDEWHTVVVTWDGEQSTAAVDGIHVGTLPYTNMADIAGSIYAKATVTKSWVQYRGWIAYLNKMSIEEAVALSSRKTLWDYYETSRFDLQYLTQPATVLVFYRTSPEMPVQYTQVSGSGDIGGVGHIEMHSTGLSVRTYDRMILDSVVLFNENLSTQDEQDFVKIPPAYQNHLVDTTRTGRIVQGYGDKQLLVNELPKSLTGNRYYQLLVSSV